MRNGANLASVLSVAEMCWGDTALLLSMPRQGLGNSAIASVANDEQLERYKGTWAAMAPNTPVPQALAQYSEVFSKMMWIGLAAGVLLFLATPLLKRLIRD